jgi:hypothetical protein
LASFGACGDESVQRDLNTCHGVRIVQGSEAAFDGGRSWSGQRNGLTRTSAALLPPASEAQLVEEGCRSQSGQAEGQYTDGDLGIRGRRRARRS